MKKIYLSLFFSVFLSFVFSSSFSQTITLGNLGTSSFCPSGTLAVPFTTDLPAGTVFKVYLSISSGNFSYPAQIGTGTTSPINITFPLNVSSGTGYLIKIVSISPSYTSNFSGALTTNGQPMKISVKNLIGREIYGYNDICIGDALTGIISANQTNVSYEWKKNGTLQTNSPNLRMIQNGVYLVSVQKIGCGNGSRTINLTFRKEGYHSTYRYGDVNQCEGGEILFTDTYYSDSVSYQWKKDGNNLIGANKDTLVINQSGMYTIDIFDKCPILKNGSSNVDNVVVFGNSIPNTININDFEEIQKESILCGTDHYTLLRQTFILPNSLNQYTYQWKKNGANIVGATKNYIENIKDVGLYALELRQGNCLAQSNGINISRKDTIKLKMSIPYPSSSFICQGEVSYLKTFDSYSGITKNLYKNGAIVNSNFNGQGSINETGKYNLSGIANGCFIIPSDTIKIAVGNITKPIIYNRKPSVCLGLSGELQDGYYNNNYKYQWYKNNKAILNENNFVFRPTESGFYKLQLTSNLCSGFSDSTEVKVSRILDKPSFKGSYSNHISICNNSLIVFGINKINPNNLLTYDSLTWKRNGQIISTRDSYSPFSANESGTYTLIGRQGTCLSEESDSIEIKIGEPVTANITGSTSIYAGQKANLALNFTGGNNWSYQTSDMGIGQTTSLSPTIKSVAPTTSQTYTITSVASNCGVGTASGSATISICPAGKTSSIQSGNWNIPSTWSCGQIPTSAYDTIIENGHIVTLPNGYQGETQKIDLRGGLNQGIGAGIKINK